MRVGKISRVCLKEKGRIRDIMRAPRFVRKAVKTMIKELLMEILEDWMREGKHIHLPFVANFKGEKK